MADNLSDKLILYVGGLDDSVNDKILYSAFIPFGEIKSIELPMDYTTRIRYFKILKLFFLERHKGFGFVEYEEYDDCLHAIENMNDAELCGRVIRVSFARPQRFKEGTQKPIWMEEDYHKINEQDTLIEANTKEKERKLFA
jgi:peptidyl-prolyl isomerase E (cyclophilin E)